MKIAFAFNAPTIVVFLALTGVFLGSTLTPTSELIDYGIAFLLIQFLAYGVRAWSPS